MPDNSSSKAQLRTDLRRARQCLDEASRLRASKAISGHCQQLPDWQGARHIALYLAADAEVQTEGLALAAREAGKSLYLPVINGENRLWFTLWEADAVLQPNRYGIPEPGNGARRLPAAELDIVFLPLVGWDRFGGRLGMGGGFYDRSLEGLDGPLRVGLGYGVQECPAIPMEAWDIRLDYVATEAALLNCQGKQP